MNNNIKMVTYKVSPHEEANRLAAKVITEFGGVLDPKMNQSEFERKEKWLRDFFESALTEIIDNRWEILRKYARDTTKI